MKFEIGNALTIVGVVFVISVLDDIVKLSLIEDFGFSDKETITRIVPYALIMLAGLRLMETKKKQ